MQVNTSIDSSKQAFDPWAGTQALRAPAPQIYKNATNQSHFADIYKPLAQKEAVNVSREATQQQGQYYNAAADAQNRSVLSGLGLLAKQKENAQQRQLAAQDMAYGWARDLMGGFNGILGGLL